MPKPIKENIELICMALTIFMAVGAVAYKARDIDNLQESHDRQTEAHEALTKEVHRDHDTLIEMANDIKWMRERMDGNER